ncbi:LytR C-terminal domain-containing protein [Arthrobacter sp. NPDC092385]|uniref:LytR C-terminal domain-containing protein n=1 Tax=Arthrobacter sp. NPDC092385 TaxID=3363943 RepID=UPI00382B0996
MTDYARDEFDKVPESSARQGTHRERLIPARSSGLGLKITVGALALLIGLGAYFILPRLGIAGGGGESAAAPSDIASSAGPSQDEAESPAPTATSEATGEAGDDESADAEATSSTDRADDLDRTQTVNVLNGTGAPGLASVAAGRLASAGWSSALPGNWAGTPLDASVVFYNGEAQRAAAEAVAEDLGITNLIDSPDVSQDISVVLGPEFQ